MKECVLCKRVYADDTLNFCLDDGSRLSMVAGLREAATIVLNDNLSSATRHSFPTYEQDIRYCETADGVRIAYATSGSGPLLVRVLGHFTHLEKEWEWPDLRHLWERLAERFSVVRYDGRGIGLSDKFEGEFTEETRQADLEAVLKAVGDEPATLFGISEGGWTAAKYSLDHPEAVTRLVLYGSYCKGARGRPGYDAEEDEAMITLIRKGWGRDTPIFRQLFTSYFFNLDADPRPISYFNDIQRAAADPETAARYWRSVHQRGDGTAMFQRVSVPTLVIHAQEDRAVDAAEGRLLASTIPGARLVLLPAGGHYFPVDSDVVEKVVAAIDRFCDKSKTKDRHSGGL